MTTATSFLARWGESVTATFSGGTTRAIQAVVNRNPAAPVAEIPGVLRPAAVVFVANSSTTGLATTEIDTATLTLTFPLRIGQTATVFRVHRIAEQDEDGILLEVR